MLGQGQGMYTREPGWVPYMAGIHHGGYPGGYTGGIRVSSIPPFLTITDIIDEKRSVLGPSQARLLI